MMSPESLAPKKAREKVYQEQNVYDAAKDRLRYLKKKFDTLVIAFSGGKDSLALITLLEKVNEEDGDKRKINILFRDEEVINTSIIDFVRTFAESGKYNFTWFAYPMNVGAYFMGEYVPLVAWDPNRPHLRERPPYAIKSLGVDTSGMDEFDLNKYELPFLNANGSTCIMLGLRASESLKRMTALTAKEKDNYLSQKGPALWSASPLYDWEEFDIFKLFYEHNQPYCSCYDDQMWSQVAYRVATSLHDKAIDKLVLMKQMEPEYYERLKAIFPQVETQVLYGQSIDFWAIAKDYPPTFAGIHKYIDDHIGDEFKEGAHSFVHNAEALRERTKHLNVGGVAVRRVFEQILKGKYWGDVPSLKEMTNKDIDYEKYGYEAG